MHGETVKFGPLFLVSNRDSDGCSWFTRIFFLKARRKESFRFDN